MRRLRICVGAAVIGAGIVAGVVVPGSVPAAAQGAPEEPAPGPSIAEGPWRGSTYAPPYDDGFHRAERSVLTVAGELHHARDRHVRAVIAIEPLDPLPQGCDVPEPIEIATTVADQAPNRWRYAFETPELTLPCNGRYRVSTVGRASLSPDMAEPRTTSPELVAELHVAAPAPTVTGVQVRADDGGVVVSWDPVADRPADLTGYRVERTAPGGDASVVAARGPDAVRARDGAPPEPLAGTTYRVYALRSGPDGAVLTSLEPGVATVEPAPQPQREAPAAAPPAAAEQPSGLVLRRPASAPRPPANRPRATAPSLPSRAGPSTAETDDGYDESLPYDPEPGEDDPVLPDDASALQYLGDDPPGAELLTPVAVALLLAVWAAHLRHLNRLSRPRSER